jgi:hypothetical protein
LICAIFFALRDFTFLSLLIFSASLMDHDYEGTGMPADKESADTGKGVADLKPKQLDLLCCDTTHDTTRYPGFLLGTLMTVGAAGEGQPVAFFVVGAESEAELSPVFAALSAR